MLKKSFAWMLIAVIAFAAAARAEEVAAEAPIQASADVAVETAEMKEAIADRTDELLGMPVGIFDLEYNDDGGLARLKIKGEAEVSTTLRGSRGDRQAREKATRDAKAAFSKFLNEQVVVVEAEGEGFTMREKNGTESAEFLSESAKLTAIFSESCLQGIVVLLDHTEGEGDQRMVTVVLGWSQKLADAAKSVQKSVHSRGKTANARVDVAPGVPNTKTVTRAAKIGEF